MALDVWIGTWSEPESRLAASFEPMAFYVLFHPHFEALREVHGVSVDMFEGGELAPDQLDLFRQLVDDVQAEISEQPERWDVHVGTQTHPERKELYEPVDKRAFLDFLAKLREAAAECERTGKSLFFCAD